MENDSNLWLKLEDPIQNRVKGSVLCPMADFLTGLLNVPVAFIPMAEGGTRIEDWFKGTTLFARCVRELQTVHAFRFIIMEIGETDVLNKNSPQNYITGLKRFQKELTDDLGTSIPIMLALSTMHPYVLVQPDIETDYRKALRGLFQEGVYLEGPDTDVLGGENRAPLHRNGHFSVKGQVRAGWMWGSAIYQAIKNNPEGIVEV